MSEPSLKERVQAHVAANPGVFSRDLAKSLQISLQSVSMAVHQLQIDGRIHRVNHLGERRAKWKAGPAPDFDPSNPTQGPGQPRQHIVKEWEPTPAPRDPLLWSMFGGQP